MSALRADGVSQLQSRFETFARKYKFVKISIFHLFEKFMANSASDRVNDSVKNR